MAGNHDNKLTMNYYSIKFNYIIYIFLATFAFYINYFFGNIGLFPIDTFSFFDTGYLITKGYHPIKDFWVISGIFGDYVQALFFLIFGNNWNAYLFHSSFMNMLISVFFFFFLNTIRGNHYLNFLLSISLSILCYPVAGTPFPYQHSYILSLFSIMIFYLAVYKDENKYWFFLPFLMLASFLSMQLPSGLINLIIIIFTVVYFIYFKKNFLKSFLFGSIICLAILIFYFSLVGVNVKDFVIQLILFPLTIGEGRILGDESAYESANLLKKLTFRGTFGHFKFIVIFIFANLVALFFYFKKNKKFFFEKQVLLNISIFFFSLSYIFHQLITANQTFIFSLIPILCGFFLIEVEEFFSISRKKLNILLIVLILFVTIKYHRDYNVNRKFMDLQNINLSKYIEAKILSKNFNNLKWVTPQSNEKEPDKEIRLLKEVSDIIANENSKEIAIITHYQFFSAIGGTKIKIFNRWYFTGNNTHPSNKKNRYYDYYNDRIYQSIKKNDIRKIYLVKAYPNEFEFINFKDQLKDFCFDRTQKTEILFLINIKNC